MRQSTSRSLLSTAALLPSVLAQIMPLMAGTGMDPMCIDDGMQTVIYEYPVFYSTVYQSAGTIFSFLGGTNSLVINNPGQTIITTTVLTTTVVQTSTTTATITASRGTKVTATLGAGIPSGTVSSIPSNSPFALAFAFDGVGGSKPDGYAAGGGLGAVTDANLFYLEGGELPSTNGGKVGRNATGSFRMVRRQETDPPVAKIEASIYYNDITTNFYLVDGALNWDSPDSGPATFYVCEDGLYAGFPDLPDGGCAKALIGAVSQVAIDLEVNGDDPTDSSTTDMMSNTDGGSDGSPAATTSFPTTTTSSGAAETSPSDGGDEPTATCPGADPADDYFGYSIYCGQAIDPVNPDDDLIPGGQDGIATLDDCTLLCDTTTGCTGLSYYEPDSICYIHSGESKDPRDAPGYDGAMKSDATGSDDGGDEGDSSSTTSTTSGAGAMTTSGSGTSASGSAGSSGTSAVTSSAGQSDSSASATGSMGSTSAAFGSSTSAAANIVSSSMASGSSAAATGSAASSSVSSAMSSSMSSSGASTSALTGSGSTASSSASSPMSSTSAISSSSSNAASSIISGSSSSASVSGAGTGGATSSASSAMTVTKSTTSAAAASTTPADLCPSANGTVAQGYNIYCGYVVDPVNDADTIQINSISFQQCLNNCTADSTCVGLSYFEDGTTCYVHKGANKDPVARLKYRGAAKVGAGGSSSSMASTTPAASSGGSQASGTSASGATGSGSSSSVSSPGTVTPNVSTSSSSSSASGASGTGTSGPAPFGNSTTTATGSSNSTSGTSASGTSSTNTGTTNPTVAPTNNSTTNATSPATTPMVPSTNATSNATSPATPPAVNQFGILAPPAGGPQDDATSANHKYCLQNCPTMQSQIQNGYRVYNGTTWGGDAYTNALATSFGACVNLCSASTAAAGGPCVGVNWIGNQNTCYLHNDCHNKETETTNTAIICAERIAKDCTAPTS